MRDGTPNDDPPPTVDPIPEFPPITDPPPKTDPPTVLPPHLLPSALVPSTDAGSGYRVEWSPNSQSLRPKSFSSARRSVPPIVGTGARDGYV